MRPRSYSWIKRVGWKDCHSCLESVLLPLDERERCPDGALGTAIRHAWAVPLVLVAQLEHQTLGDGARTIATRLLNAPSVGDHV